MAIPVFKVAMNDTVPKAVEKVLLSGYVGQGEKVEEFEKAFARYVFSSLVPLSVNSCTSALDLSLHLIGVKPGDEVITTPVTCTATNGVIVNRRAIPVWADVDPFTGLISPEDVAKKITSNTKAIIAVDWAGRSCDYISLRSFGIPVIQDSAHRLTKLTDNNRGDYICWSFQAIKHLTTGDGGMLLPPEDQLERARLLRWYGLDRRSKADFRCSQNITEVGYKYHMNDIAATIGIENLKLVLHNIGMHVDTAQYYDTYINNPLIQKPEFSYTSSWWLYSLFVNDRAVFTEYLKVHGIDCSPVHARNDKHTAFYYPNGSLPGVDYFDTFQVSIPCGWWLTDQDKEYVVKIVNNYKGLPHG